MATRKVLVLHGFSQNASIFSKRLGALRKQCDKDVELVFIDAPHVLYPADLSGFVTPLLEVSAATNDIYEDSNLTPRGWWKADAARTKATGLDQSLNVLRDTLQKHRFNVGPVDAFRSSFLQGIFGFSQGAALAVLLSALLERPEVYPPFLIDGKSPHPPFQFCVAVSGFRVGDPISDTIFKQPYVTPTLIIVGRNDIIVTEERTKPLFKLAANYRLEEHDGGHFVPSKADWRKFLHHYMVEPSPSIVSPSVPR